MNRTTSKLSLQEFLDLPESNDRAWVMDTKAQSATIFRRDELL